MTILGFEKYIMHSKETLIVAGRRTKRDVVETAKEYNKRRKLERGRKLLEGTPWIHGHQSYWKKLHGSMDIIFEKKRSSSTRMLEMSTARRDKDGNR